MTAQPAGVRPRLLLVDDDVLSLRAWERNLKAAFELAAFSDGEKAQSFVAENPVDVAMIDVFLPKGSGFDVLQTLRTAQPAARAVMLSGAADPKDVVKAMRLGAADFLTKPLPLQSLSQRLGELAGPNNPQRSRIEFTGSSHAAVQVRTLVQRIAPSLGPVLISGEAGTGKELVARSLHAKSLRPDGPFISVNCAAIPHSLIDAELFGQARGAVSGALAEQPGLYEAAHTGVLYLSEVHELPLATQARLVRAVQTGETRRMGSTRPHTVDVRVIAATDVSLKSAVKARKFRADLLSRLSTFQLSLPPLRQRLDDLPLLCGHLLNELHWRSGTRKLSLALDALNVLEEYEWPGNVRELANVLEHAATMAAGPHIHASDLPELKSTAPSLKRAMRGDAPIEAYGPARSNLIETFDRQYLQRLFDLSGGVLSNASRLSGVDRTNLRRLMKRYRMSYERDD